MDIIATLLYDVDRVLAYGRFNIPESPDDKHFKREILKTTVDIEKLFRGIATNFITKSILKDLKGNLNFEPKFPLKKVKDLLQLRQFMSFFAIPGTSEVLESERHRSVLSTDLLERHFEFAICREDLGIEENDLSL